MKRTIHTERVTCFVGEVDRMKGIPILTTNHNNTTNRNNSSSSSCLRLRSKIIQDHHHHNNNNSRRGRGKNHHRTYHHHHHPICPILERTSHRILVHLFLVSLVHNNHSILLLPILSTISISTIHQSHIQDHNNNNMVTKIPLFLLIRVMLPTLQNSAMIP